MNRFVTCLVPVEWRDSIDSCLVSQLGSRWTESPNIQVEWLTQRQRHDVRRCQRQIDSIAMRRPAGDIVLVGQVYYQGPQLPGLTTSVRRLKDPTEFHKRIAEILEANGVDLVSERAGYLRDRWETKTITREHVAHWLSQFGAIGSFEWVGRGVLSALSCFSTADLVDHLGVQDLEGAQELCYYSPDADPLGSSTPLAHAVNKRLSNVPVVRFDIAGLSQAPGQSILIEDCALSGIEFGRFAENQWPDNGATSEECRLVKLRLRFAILTNGAEVKIRKELTSKGLHNVRLETQFSHRIESLTDAGLSALEEDRFWCSKGGHCLHPKTFIRQQVLNDCRLWGTIERAETARKLLRRIGEQLYRVDFSQRNTDAEHSHTDAWFEQAGLGAGGLALTIALARSVPKSTLPVIWARGTVKMGGKTIEWIPLLPHA